MSQIGLAGDRRRSPRRKFQRKIGLLDDGRFSVVQALVLSEAGIVVQSSGELAPTSDVVLTILIPDGEPVVTRSLISSRAKDRKDIYRLSFTNLPLHHRRAIRNYVSGKTEEEMLSDGPLEAMDEDF